MLNLGLREEPTTLDSLHAAAVDAVCSADRDRVATGARQFLRLAAPHEFCLPGEPCLTWPTVVEVTAIAPGLRTRRPIDAGMLAA
jgi:hypothetical protein